jgi:ABC-type lipoprotein release transport system permease subunit
MGLVAALGASQALAKMVDETEFLDLKTYLAVSMLLMTVSAGASYFPAAKAAKTDPINAFRRRS